MASPQDSRDNGVTEQELSDGLNTVNLNDRSGEGPDGEPIGRRPSDGYGWSCIEQWHSS